MGHKQTLHLERSMSALPLAVDIDTRTSRVRKVRDRISVTRTGGLCPAARRPNYTATTTAQCIYSSVSRASLWKTGVFLSSAGDFWECLAQKVRTSVSRDFSR
jgi:hypothetical protein